MDKSEQIKDLAIALSKAQGELTPAPYDSTNPAFRSKYASLASFQETYRPVLARHGLSLVQTVSSDADGHYVSSMLLHITGQFLSCRMKLILQKNDMQGLGSATTYAKRYQASAMLGISADEDDDGNAASRPAPTRAPIKNFAPKPKTEEIDELDRALKGSPNPGDFVIGGGKFKGKRVRDVPKVDINSFIDYVHAEQSKNSEFSLGKDAADYYSAAIQFLSEQGEHR